MAYGYQIISGTGSVVTTNSSVNPPGVFIDSFIWTYNTVVTVSYPNYVGQTLLAITAASPSGISNVVVNIDQSTKTVTVQRGPSAISFFNTSNAYVIILGV